MARKRKKKKQKKSVSFFKAENLLKLIVIAFIVGILTFFLWGMQHFFTKSDFFEITEIQIEPEGFSSQRESLEKSFLGENIFAVELKDIAQFLRDDHAKIRSAKVKRLFPDKLLAALELREPYAVIDYSRGVIVDSKGFVLDKGDLPDGMLRIEGLSLFFRMPEMGDRIESEELDRALMLAEMLKERIAEDIVLEYIKLGRGNSIEVGIEGVPVKFGAEDYSQKIGQLNTILSDERIELSQIRYIDLRFDDSIIAPR